MDRFYAIAIVLLVSQFSIAQEKNFLCIADQLVGIEFSDTTDPEVKIHEPIVETSEQRFIFSNNELSAFGGNRVMNSSDCKIDKNGLPECQGLTNSYFYIAPNLVFVFHLNAVGSKEYSVFEGSYVGNCSEF